MTDHKTPTTADIVRAMRAAPKPQPVQPYMMTEATYAKVKDALGRQGHVVTNRLNLFGTPIEVYANKAALYEAVANKILAQEPYCLVGETEDGNSTNNGWPKGLHDVPSRPTPDH